MNRMSCLRTSCLMYVWAEGDAHTTLSKEKKPFLKNVFVIVPAQCSTQVGKPVLYAISVHLSIHHGERKKLFLLIRYFVIKIIMIIIIWLKSTRTGIPIG